MVSYQLGQNSADIGIIFFGETGHKPTWWSFHALPQASTLQVATLKMHDCLECLTSAVKSYKFR